MVAILRTQDHAISRRLAEQGEAIRQGIITASHRDRVALAQRTSTEHQLELLRKRYDRQAAIYDGLVELKVSERRDWTREELIALDQADRQCQVIATQIERITGGSL